jgi:hypothetical protein
VSLHLSSSWCRGWRRAALLLGLVAAAPALAYVPPVGAILRRLGLKREELALQSLEVRGTLLLNGETARAAAQSTGLPLTGDELSVPALLSFKMPGRCRIELLPAQAAEAERPVVVSRSRRVTGAKGLDRVPAAVSLVQGLCATIGERPTGATPERTYADAFGHLGVALNEVHFGRFAGRIAYVVGGRPADAKPLAWIDKQTYQPIRLVSGPAGALVDVRLLDYGSPAGGDWFPRAVEVYKGADLQARFTTEKASANPKVADSLF